MDTLNKKIIFTIYVIVLLVVGIFFINLKKEDNIVLEEVKTKITTRNNNSVFAIMLQEKSGVDKYIESDSTSWPISGYEYNSEKSACIDDNGQKIEGEVLIYDDANHKASIKTDRALYCYLYFDKEKLPIYEELYEDDTTLLGSPETNNDGYLIYHDGEGDYTNSSYEAGDKSYRFAGNNPDNYVCLDANNDAEGECSDIKKLYRVIGWFLNEETGKYQMKLIKSEYITADELGGNFTTYELTALYNDYTPRSDITNAVGFNWGGGTYYNNWIASKLNQALNDSSGKYLKSLSTYVDADLIDDTEWYIGGGSEKNFENKKNVKSTYEYEIGINKLTTESNGCTDKSTTLVQCREDLLYHTAKIGLMYINEYNGAFAPEMWTSYNNTKLRNLNWLYNGVYEWTLTRTSDHGDYVFYLSGDGSGATYDYGTRGRLGSSEDRSCMGIRPTFMLSSSAEVISGTGSKSSPWRIKI